MPWKVTWENEEDGVVVYGGGGGSGGGDSGGGGDDAIGGRAERVGEVAAHPSEVTR